MSDTPGKSRILLGRITAAHGIRGEVLIRTYTGEPGALATYGPLSDETNQRVFKVRGVRASDKGLIARIEGVATRNDAEALKGTDLFVAREKLPKTGNNEYYHADLVGLRAYAPQGDEIGTVVSVANFGAGDLLEIQLPDSKATEFVPFTNAVVPDVDLAGGRLTILMPVMTGEPEPSNDAGGS